MTAWSKKKHAGIQRSIRESGVRPRRVDLPLAGEELDRQARLQLGQDGELGVVEPSIGL
jgi:hypothetical protein